MKLFSHRLLKKFLIAFTICVANLQASQSGAAAQAQETAIQDKTIVKFKQLVQKAQVLAHIEKMLNQPSS